MLLCRIICRMEKKEKEDRKNVGVLLLGLGHEVKVRSYLKSYLGCSAKEVAGGGW